MRSDKTAVDMCRFMHCFCTVRLKRTVPATMQTVQEITREAEIRWFIIQKYKIKTQRVKLGNKHVFNRKLESFLHDLNNKVQQYLWCKWTVKDHKCLSLLQRRYVHSTHSHQAIYIIQILYKQVFTSHLLSCVSVLAKTVFQDDDNGVKYVTQSTELSSYLCCSARTGNKVCRRRQ